MFVLLFGLLPLEMSAYSSMCKKIQSQGIVTILGSDCDRGRACAATSLRRTLSADMSSKKWLSQNALLSPMMKKFASSEELSRSKATTSHHSSLSSSEGEEEEEEEEMKELGAEEAEQERFQIWSTIQRDKKEKHHEKEPTPHIDTWSSILLSYKAKGETSNPLPLTPYIHPLVKRSKSSLSEKSLEICTESLGSESGSDHVSSNSSSNSNLSPSETEDSEEEQRQEQQQHVTVHEVPKHIHHVVVVKKSSMPRCFPPPLPSLHMRSLRDGNGRLFLEAVPVASQNNKFCAQRQDGRLILTFAGGEEEEESKEDDREVAEEEEEQKDQVWELEEEFTGFEDYDDEEGKEYEEDENYDEGEEEEDDEILEAEGGDHGDVEAVIEQAPLLSSGVIPSVHRLALMMNKPIGVVNRNTKWSETFNPVVNFEGVSMVQHGPMAQSLPPRPSVARLIPSTPTMAPVAAASLNAYECSWGTKHASKVAPVPKPLSHQQNRSSVENNSSDLIVCGDVNWTSNDRQQLLVMRGKNGDYLVHNSKSCKDSRRSFLFWEPHCIAT